MFVLRQRRTGSAMPGTRGSRRRIFGRTEQLEDRRVCATFTVTSGFDSGVGLGELRTMIFQSNNTPGHDTIVFAPYLSTINLILGELDIIDDVTIDGSTTLDGNVTIRSALGNSRIFNIDDTDTVIDISVSINQLTLTNGSVVGSASNAGGAIRNEEFLRLENSVLSGNHAGHGGGIANYGALYLDRVTLEGNEATERGGGIYSAEGGSLEMERVTITNNVADEDGGGIYLRHSGTQMKQVTLAYNAAGRRGGGIFIEQAGGPMIAIAHGTITGNTASLEGGGLHASAATIQLDQTIVAGNFTSVSPGTPDVFSGSNMSARFSLIGNRLGSTLVEASPDANGNIVGGPLAGPIDPMLSPLANNGGATATMLPQSSSVAINAGDPLFSSPPSFDQRGAPYPRVAATRIDIGAVEYQPQGPDFDGNGVLDCNDVDALVDMIASGANHPTFDLTGDGQVTVDDLDHWLDLAGDINLGNGADYLYGDANLDGFVDGTDFGTWNANKFTAQAAWCAGDFSADGFVDGSDFGHWNQNKFTSSLARRKVDVGPPVVDRSAPNPAASAYCPSAMAIPAQDAISLAQRQSRGLSQEANRRLALGRGLSQHDRLSDHSIYFE
jgi:predicted outer membrane repeat protein